MKTFFAPSNPDAATAQAWNGGVTSGNVLSLALSVAEIGGGGTIAEGSLAITGATGGLSVKVTGPTFLAGSALVINGAYTMQNAYRNLSSDEGMVEATEGSGEAAGSSASSTASDNNGNSSIGIRRQNKIPNLGSPNSTEANPSGTTVKKYGPNGHIQKEYNKGHTTVGTPEIEQNDHIHDYIPMPQNPSGTGTRMPGRRPKANELRKDFGL